MARDRETYSDERSEAIAGKSNAFGFRVMSFLVLADVMYRGFVLKEAAWDLMAIVVSSGLMATIYQVRYRTVNKRTAYLAMFAAVLGVIVALGAIVFLTKSR
jgi:Co/Zn/Cd efflux system component